LAYPGCLVELAFLALGTRWHPCVVGNRVVGETDDGHNAYSINPSTLARDETNGTIIYSKHVHKALRRHLGLEDTAVDAAFKFTNTEDFNFFGYSD